MNILIEVEVLVYRGNLSDIESRLVEDKFVKINSGCIVNLEWTFQDRE